MSSAQRRKLADISNLEGGHAEQMKREEETLKQQQAMLFSSKGYAEKLEKENMTLMKALAHRNKIIELSGVEIQKLRINLRNVQEKNLQLAQANSHMLAELNANRDSLKLLQHELCCKNVLLEAKKMQTEEQGLPSTENDPKDRAHDMNHKDTKRKRTSRIKPSESSIVKPIQAKENGNNKRSISASCLVHVSCESFWQSSKPLLVFFGCMRVSGVIDTTVIPEVTCQTEDDTEKGIVSQGTNQIVDNIVNKKFVLDPDNPDGVQSKRQCVRRKSTRFDVQESEQTETVREVDDAKETKETARICLKRRSARLRPEEAEPCKSFHERDEPKETIKGRRVSLRQQSARFDFQVTGTVNNAVAGKVCGVIDTTGIPEITCQTEDDAEKGFDFQGTHQIVDNIVNEKLVLDPANPIKDSVHSNRQSVGRKSTRVDVQVTGQTETVLETGDAKETKETARLSLRRVSARLRPKEAEPCKSFHERDEVKETINKRRVSSRQQSATFDFQEPEVTETLSADDARTLVSDGSEAVEPSESRRDTKDTDGRRRRVTTRRQSAKGTSQTATDTDGAIKDIVTDPSTHINTVQECDLLPSTMTVSEEEHEKESVNKPKAEETGGMMRRTSMRRTSRHAAEKVQSYREVSLKVKLRRDC